MEPTKIALFKGKGIRRTFHHGEWWFSVVDVCEALTESPDARAGGDIAGGARKKLEERLGRSVVSKKNYLKNREKLDGK